MTSSRTVRLTLRECAELGNRWSGITGLASGSEEWGEVCQVLHDAGMLAADRPEEPALFDVAAGDGQADAALRLRLCVMVGAMVASGWEGHDKVGVATSTAVVAALFDRFYDRELLVDTEAWLDHLSTEIPRRCLAVVDHPALALDLLDVEPWPVPGLSDAKRASDLAEALWRAAAASDEFARAVFADLAERPGNWPRLVPMCTGQWLLFDPTPAGELPPGRL